MCKLCCCNSSDVNSEVSAARPVNMLEKRHSCTDLICLILFLVFMAVQAGVSVFAYWNGDPRQLMYPHDSSGELCTGSTPYLFYFDLSKCLGIDALVTGCMTPQICVSQCPTETLFYLVPTHISSLTKFCKSKDLLSQYGTTTPTLTSTQYKNLIDTGSCPTYTLESKALYYRCLPSIITDAIDLTQQIVVSNGTGTTTPIIDPSSNQPITYQLIKTAITYISQLLSIKTTAQYIFEDFANALYLLIVLLLIAAVASFLYILIARWIVGPLIWLSLLAIVALLAFATWFSFDRYVNLKTNTTQNVTIQLDINYYLNLSYTWLAAGIISALVLIIVLLILLVLIKRLRLAIGLITEASKAVTGIFFIVLWPIIPFILQMGCLVYSVSVAVYLSAAGKPLYRVTNTTAVCCGTATFKVGDSCDPTSFNNQSQNATCTFYRYGYGNPFNTAETTAVINFLNDYQWLPQLYNAFIFYWLQAFCVGLDQMILAGCFAIWYWSKSKKLCILLTSVKDTLVYHLGSVAFGSLIIAIVKFVRMLIQFVENRVKSATGNNAEANKCVKFVFCCCKCCFWCLEKVLKFINRNAYIMVAIYGKNFCASARDAIMLLASNPLRALVLDRVTDFILFLGKLVITTGVGVLAFYFFAKKFYVDPSWKTYFAPDLHYYWVPLVCVIVATYFIAKIFFTVFEMAVDTIFLCALKDLEVNDGSVEKPYCMSTEMRKIMSVKNVEKKRSKKKGNGEENAAYDEDKK